MSNTNRIRRINFFGGPGSGKSTISASVFSNMKQNGFSVEYTPEYIKKWTYIPIQPISLDALYVQSKQLYSEDIILRGSTDYIVSDSPVYLQAFFAWYYSKGKYAAGDCWEIMLKIAHMSEALYPSLNIFVERDDSYYTKVGRYEEIEEAKNIDKEMKSFMSNIAYESFVSISCHDIHQINSYVINSLKGNNDK